MVKNVSQTHTAAADQAWKQLEDFIDSVSHLAANCASPDEFFEGLLADSVRALGVNGAGFWLVSDGESVELARGVNLDPETHGSDATHVNDEEHGVDEKHGWHRALLLRQVSEQSAAWITKHWTSPDADFRNPSRQNLLLQPILIEEEVVGVLEYQIATDPSPSVTQSLTEIAETLAELTSHFLARFEVRRLRKLSHVLHSFSQALSTFNGNYDLESASYAVCNEARRLVNAQRASLILISDGRARALAVSNIDSVNRRSESVKSLEALATSVAQVNEPCDYVGNVETIPEGSRLPMANYIRTNEAKRVSVVPVTDPAGEKRDRSANSQSVVFIFDWFEEEPEHAGEPVAIGLITSHGGTAVLRAQELSGNSMSRMLVGMARSASRSSPSRRTSLLVLFGCFLLALGAGSFVPMQFTIRSDGKLEPANYFHVFAPFDGKIQTIHVQHDQQVGQGSPLLEMINDELRLRRSDLAGELQETIAELESLNAELANPGSEGFDALENQQTGAARLGLLNKRYDRLEAQLSGIDKQLAELKVNSPIDGQVVTWDVIQELSKRPVRRGQRLLSIADTQGEWYAELQIEDRDVGYVLEALRSQTGRDSTEGGLPVQFTLRSNSSQTIEGRLFSISETTQIDPFGTEYVVAKTRFDRSQMGDIRPGARLIARIDCGSRPLTFVWFRDLIEFVQTRLLF